MDVVDLARFVEMSNRIESLLGVAEHKTPITTEQISRRNARRSIVLARALEAGQQIAESDLTYKRPGTGVSPLHWDEVIGRKTARALKADDVLQWDDLAHADR